MKIKIIIAAIVVIAIMGISLSIGAKFMFREIGEEKYLGLEDIDEIKVMMSANHVHVIRTKTGGEARFHYYGKSLQEINLVSEISNKTITVSARRKYIFLGTCEDMRLDIYLPGEYRQKISVSTSSGKVTMDAFDLAGLTLNTSSGGMEAENINAENIALNTTSGKVNIGNLSAKKLEIKATSASINIGKCTVSQAEIMITSGDVTMENSSGNLAIKGTSGNVSINCREFSNRDIVIETTSGNITLGLPGTAEFLIDARTASGKFQSDFPIDKSGKPDKRVITGQTDRPKNKLTLHTQSGGIKIVNNGNNTER
ncbi:MAG: DUF4097 family beta strand repeat protein [Dehalococcoidales bacterium]|nr:DUF4097 family beta strand repeat protein [Dehalococcoidales bacterium]